MVSSKIAKNSSFFLISQLISYAIGFIYTIFIARYLGSSNFGILSFALSFISILSIFTDLGLNSLMTREIARDKSKNLKYLSNFLTIKLFLVFIVFTLTFAVIYLVNYSEETSLCAFSFII